MPLLIAHGGDVKATSESEIEGYLVRFGSAESADADGDYFTLDTDFGGDPGQSLELPVYYDHGLSSSPAWKSCRKKRLGRGRVEFKDDGVFFKATFKPTVEPAVVLMADIEGGKVGWSSGSIDRLVLRQSEGAANRVLQWPLAEASLSYTPVDTRNRASAIKSLVVDTDEEGFTSLVETSERLVADIEGVVGLFQKAQSQREASHRRLSEAKRQSIVHLSDALKSLVDATTPRITEEQRRELMRLLVMDALRRGNQDAKSTRGNEGLGDSQ